MWTDGSIGELKKKEGPASNLNNGITEMEIETMVLATAI